jgi:hypothetical protein
MSWIFFWDCSTPQSYVLQYFFEVRPYLFVCMHRNQTWRVPRIVFSWALDSTDGENWGSRKNERCIRENQKEIVMAYLRWWHETAQMQAGGGSGERDITTKASHWTAFWRRTSNLINGLALHGRLENQEGLRIFHNWGHLRLAKMRTELMGKGRIWDSWLQRVKWWNREWGWWWGVKVSTLLWYLLCHTCACVWL